MKQQSANTDPAVQRSQAKRTVWILAAVAFGIYAAFILQSVLHK